MPDQNLAEQFMDRLRGLAEDLELDEETTEKFVNEGMARKGFKRIVSWGDPDDGDGNSNDGGGFFGSPKPKSREIPNRRQRNSGGFGMSQYGA
jgi:hypothetical protein